MMRRIFAVWGWFWSLKSIKNVKRISEVFFVVILTFDILSKIYVHVVDFIGVDVLSSSGAMRVWSWINSSKFVEKIESITIEYYQVVMSVAITALLVERFYLKKRYADLKIRHAKVDAYYRIDAITDGHLMALSSQNSIKDYEIFRCLFENSSVHHTTFLGKNARKSAIEQAILTVRANIDDVLNCAREMFTACSGVQCAACVQVLRDVDGAPDEAYVETIRRDGVSTVLRGVSSDKNFVRNNSIHEKIFRDGESDLFVDNLAAEVSAGRVATSSRRAGSVYNSIYIKAVRSLDPSVEHPVATLCVDSENPMPEDRLELYRHAAVELTWRLSVMLYRISVLGNELKLISET